MFRWEVSEWSQCQADCNGLKTRNVECVSDEDGAKLLVSGHIFTIYSFSEELLQITRKFK